MDCHDRGHLRDLYEHPGYHNFSAAGLSATLYAFSDVSKDGWGSTTVLGFLTAGLICLAIFVAVELLTSSRGREPLLIPLRPQPMGTARPVLME